MFRQIDNIIPVHERLTTKLRERQAVGPVVEHILDILDAEVRA